MAKIGPEHALQVMVHKAVRAHVPQPHFFFSVDRSKKSGEFTHVREKDRGLIPGCPDTFLIYPGLPTIAIELKAKGKKVEVGSTQDRVGQAIIKAGGSWSWCSSVYDYLWILNQFGVPLQGSWALSAIAHDATLESAAIRREEAGGTVSKRRFNLEAQISLLGSDSLLPNPKPPKKRRAVAKPTAAKLRAGIAVRERAAAKGVRV